jgi:hypothetical protein
MAKEDRKIGGGDAATMKPRFVPDYMLIPRDDSGGPEWQPYSQQWDDGGFVTGAKKHLSVRGGDEDPIEGDEQTSTASARNKGRGGRDAAPSSSKRQATREEED